MEQSPSWEANWFSASQEIPRILWNPKVHYRIHKCPPPVPILSQLDQVCQFLFVSSVCLLVRVTMVDKNRAVVCCLLATSAMMLCEKKKRKRKMWSKKWCLTRNISCDAHLLNDLLETDVALRWCQRGVGRQTEETVGFPEWTAQFCVWKTTGKESSETCAIAYKKLRSLLSFPGQVWRHTVKSLSLTESV